MSKKGEDVKKITVPRDSITHVTAMSVITVGDKVFEIDKVEISDLETLFKLKGKVKK